MISKKFQNLMVLAPIVCIVLMYFLNWSVTNTDALTYHLYYARVITEKNLNFFSDRPIPLANELGFGLSAYYPWLYSHLIALCQNLLGDSYDTSVLVLSTILYLLLVFQYSQTTSRLLIATYLMLPLLYESFFVSGTNYFLTSVLSYLLFNLVSRKIGIFQLAITAIVSFLIINTHVFGIFICNLIFLYAFFTTKRYIYLWFFAFAFIYQLAHNFFLTGSITFPFLLEIFPTKNFDSQEWSIVQDQIRKGLRFEFFNLGLKNWLFMFACFASSAYVITRNFLPKHQKILLLLLLLPTLSAYLIGFRHRIIFFSCFIFILIHIIENKKISLIMEIREIWFYFKPKILYIAYILVFLITVKSIFNFYKKQTGEEISIYLVKNCFYNSVSDLSINNKILLTETELMRIDKPENIHQVDGLIDRQIRSLKSTEDFVEYLKNKKIKYLTHSPLSTTDLEFSQRTAYADFLPQLVAKGYVKLYKDCVADSHYNNKILPSYQNKILRNWLIYEVK